MFPFPPPPPFSIGWIAIAENLGLLAIAFSILFGLFLPNKIEKRAQPVSRLSVGLLVLIFLGLILGLGYCVVDFRTNMDIYFGMVWFVCGIALIPCLIRLASGRRHTIGSALGWLGCTSLMLWLLSPMISSAGEAGRRSNCRQNLTTIHSAFQQIQKVTGRFPDAINNGIAEPQVSWRVALMPYLEENSAYRAYDQSAKWNDDRNLPVAKLSINTYTCLSSHYRQDEQGRNYSSYAMVTGKDAAFPNGRGLRESDFKDGLSKTIIMGEACGLNIVWTEPRDIDLDLLPLKINSPGREFNKSDGAFSSWHNAQTTHVMFADGRVTTLHNNTDASLFKALTTPAAGDKTSFD